jgi:FAD/FMN-containing dehydrogenase
VNAASGPGPADEVRMSNRWVRQYGDAWASLTALKRRYDPDGILTPGPGILP